MKIVWQLFIVFLQIGLLSFGGGMASLPWIQNIIVEQNTWLTPTGFADLVTLAQMTPGPIGINAASYVGVKMGGILGAIVATSASILAPVLITFTIAYLYQKYENLTFLKHILSGLRPASLALMLGAVLLMVYLTIFKAGQLEFLATIFFIISLILKKYYRLNLLQLMLFIAPLYTVLAMWMN